MSPHNQIYYCTTNSLLISNPPWKVHQQPTLRVGSIQGVYSNKRKIIYTRWAVSMRSSDRPIQICSKLEYASFALRPGFLSLQHTAFKHPTAVISMLWKGRVLIIGWLLHLQNSHKWRCQSTGYPPWGCSDSHQSALSGAGVSIMLVL